MPDEIIKKTITTTNYGGNSHKQRQAAAEEEPRPKVEKVITGEAIKRKRSIFSRIGETFTGDDAHSVGNYILFEVLIPATKSMISDMVTTGAERMLFGESRPRSGGGYRPSSNYTPYNRVSSSRASDPPWDTRDTRSISRQSRSVHNFDEIVIPTRGEAERVLDKLFAQLERYQVVTVSDLYDSVGITGSFVDDKWGWSDLTGASVRPVRGGYLLVLPRTSAID